LQLHPTGRQALEMTAEYYPDIVLRISICRSWNGLTAAGQILKIAPGTGCIIISGERDPETIQDAMSYGNTGISVKPFTVDELAMAIEASQ